MSHILPTRAAYDPILGDRVQAELTADLEAGVASIHEALGNGTPPELVGHLISAVHYRLQTARNISHDEALGLVVGMLVPASLYDMATEEARG